MNSCFMQNGLRTVLDFYEFIFMQNGLNKYLMLFFGDRSDKKNSKSAHSLISMKTWPPCRVSLNKDIPNII